MGNTHQPLRIDYVSEGFPAGGSVANGPAVLSTFWDELLWAAITVGRPNRQYVFRHGDASRYEALFRWSLIRMALEQRGPTAYRLRRTAAVRTLDPTEKGAVSYFLGMTLCKLFSARLLDAPWVLHLDVFRPMLNAVLRGRSRPDLVGQTSSNDWVVLESKGRVSAPNAGAKNKAKQQAQRVISVNGAPPSFCVGCITYIQREVLQFYWRDPEPEATKHREVIRVTGDDGIWRHYYSPVLELVRSQPEDFGEMLLKPSLMSVTGLDIAVGIHPFILEHLVHARWGDAKQSCLQMADKLHQSDYQADGIRVVAGSTWSSPFEE